MKKILFVCTGSDYPEGAFTFLETLHGEEPICVTGLFFCPLDYSLIASASNVPIAAPYLRVIEKEKEIVAKSKRIFEDQCKALHIKYNIHENTDHWDKALFAKASRFSDLAVLSGELFCDDAGALQPNSYLHEALHASECPVVVLPEHFAPVERLVIAYDGSKDCVFALKQFCHVFPQYLELPTEIVHAKDDETEDIPELEELRSFARLRFTSMATSKLNFKASHYFASWISEKQSVMLIAGSFGRSSLSYATKKSFVDQAIRGHRMPVFIAHT